VKACTRPCLKTAVPNLPPSARLPGLSAANWLLLESTLFPAITCGGGGAIITNDKDLAKKARYLTTKAKINHQWQLAHDEIGYNFRMPDLSMYKNCQTGELKNARWLVDWIVNLPSSARINA